MKIKTNKEAVIYDSENDITFGVIPLKIWDQVIEYELRQWVLDNALLSRWSIFMEKLNIKITEKK